MISVKQAEDLIFQQVQARVDPEWVVLNQAIGRILAEPIHSRLDFPHWDNSAMDGYAVRYEDLTQGHWGDKGRSLVVVEEIPAGAVPQVPVRSGEAARILTGSMMPEGADTVVMQEWTVRSPNSSAVQIQKMPPHRGHFVRHQGSFYRSGSPLLQAGLRLSGAEMAVLAAAQCLQVPVFKRVRVGILSTGNELVAPDQTLQPGQIVDSNQVALRALLWQAGFETIALGPVKDDWIALKTAMAAAITECDVVISSGGVSVGDYDYVEALLEALGGEIWIRSIAVKPGKPLTFATFPDEKLYFGLPGNPVSALVTFWRFVLPALRKRSGQSEPWSPLFMTATSLEPLKSDGKRESYVWGRIENLAHPFQQDLQFYPAAGSGSSGNLVNLAGSNALAVLPIGQTQVAAGDRVTVMLI